MPKTPEDEATSYLRGAARSIAKATAEAKQWGIESPEAEAEALAEVKRALRMYEERTQ